MLNVNILNGQIKRNFSNWIKSKVINYIFSTEDTVDKDQEN